MPNLAAISQATTEINRGGWNPSPTGIERFNSPKELWLGANVKEDNLLWHFRVGKGSNPI